MDGIRDEVESQTDDQLKASLAKDGYTDDKLAELARKQRALLEASRPRPSVRPIGPAREARKRRWSTSTVVFAAGLSFAAAAAAVVVLGKTDNLPEAFKPERRIPSGTATTSSPFTASDLRSSAARAFFEHRYADCLQDLDDAKAMDPKGDAEEATQSMRAEATARSKHP
jgi:hypothetical protein